MTKDELMRALSNGQNLVDILELRPGQDCEIFKADNFSVGREILYIPDLWLNELVVDRAATPEEIEEILDHCYTGEDFLIEADGDADLARNLFWYCDWQHPSAALPELLDEPI